MDTPHRHGGGTLGIVRNEAIIVVVVVLVLVLGSLLLLNPGQSDDYDFVPPWRQTNAVYAFHALEEFRGHMQAYYDMTATLPGDRRDASYTNSTGSVIGNGNGHIEKGNEENIKVFRDLHANGITEDDTIRVRGRDLNLYWMQVQWDDGTADEGHYMRIDGFNHLEAQAMDRHYDDGNGAAGQILYFPYEEDDQYVTLIVKFSLYQ